MARLSGLVLTIGAVALLALGGCNKVSKQDHDRALQENNELRERVASLEQADRDKAAQLASQEQQLRQAESIGVRGDDGYREPTSRGSRGESSSIATITVGGAAFIPGSATLSPEGKAAAERAAAQINAQYSGAAIRVEGHTDSDPPNKMKAKFPTNEVLSEARAEAVKKVLVSKGISASRIETIGYGSSQPKGSKSASRRVEIVVLAE